VIVSLLLFAIVGFVVYLGSRRLSGLAMLAVAAFGLIGIAFVISPDLATHVAHLVGVGRGTDLVLYVAIVGGLFLAASFFLRLRKAESQLADLARSVALAQAEDAR
jgi:hypothetical protein